MRLELFLYLAKITKINAIILEASKNIFDKNFKKSVIKLYPILSVKVQQALKNRLSK